MTEPNLFAGIQPQFACIIRRSGDARHMDDLCAACGYAKGKPARDLTIMLF